MNDAEMNANEAVFDIGVCEGTEIVGLAANGEKITRVVLETSEGERWSLRGEMTVNDPHDEGEGE